MAVGVGLSVSNAKAVMEAVFGRKSEFIRTPKYGNCPTGLHLSAPLSSRGRKRRSLLPYVELLFGAYMAGCTIDSLMHLRSVLTAPFLVIFTFGFFYVAVSSFISQRAVAPAASGEPAAAPPRD